MKILNSKEAEELAKEIFSTEKDAESREFHLSHSKAVVETSLILAKNTKADKELLKIAGWLHDIGQTINKDTHAEHSLKILEQKGFNLNEKLIDCILNHGTSGKPKSIEGKIIRIADKASMLNPETNRIFVDYSMKKQQQDKEKDLDFIKKIAMSGVDLLREL